MVNVAGDQGDGWAPIRVALLFLYIGMVAQHVSAHKTNRHS